VLAFIRQWFDARGRSVQTTVFWIGFYGV
jgi:hypothetical protein